MKLPFTKQNKQNNTTPSEQEAFSSPNLYNQELFKSNTLTSGQKTLVLGCKVFTITILVLFFGTSLISYLKVNAYTQAVQELNMTAEELKLYTPVEKRVLALDKRLALHKKLAPQRKSFVDKVSSTLTPIGTAEDLKDFEYAEGVLTVTLDRDDILDITQLIAKLLEEDYISQIAILSANLNPVENFYTVKLEITYK